MTANRYPNEIVRTRASRNARRVRARAGVRVRWLLARCACCTGTVPLVADMGLRAVVVVQEDLLERGLAARERGDRMPRQRGDQRADAPGDLEPQRVRTAALRMYARKGRELRRPARECDLDRLGGEVAKLL